MTAKPILFAAFLFSMFFLNTPCFSQLQNAIMLTVSCTSESGISTDQTAIRFLEEATDSFDSEWDAYKFMNPGSTPNIYSQSDEQYAINALTNTFYTKDVFVHFKSKVSGIYSLSADEIGEFDADWSITLIDRFTQEEINLRREAVYTFTSKATDKSERFLMKFEKSPTNSFVTSSAESPKVREEYIYTYQDNLYIHLPSLPSSASISVYDVSGAQVIHSEACHSEYSFKLEKTGIYNVSVLTNDNAYSTKVCLF